MKIMAADLRTFDALCHCISVRYDLLIFSFYKDTFFLSCASIVPVKISEKNGSRYMPVVRMSGLEGVFLEILKNY